MNYADEQSDVRTITQSVTQASADSYPSGPCDDSELPVFYSTDSVLSETQRRIIQTIGGERGEALRRNLIDNAKALQGARNNANRIAASVRFDVQEYIGLLEARFATEFRQIGADIGRLINSGKRRDSGIRKIKR